MHPADTFIIFVYTIKMTLIYRRLGLLRVFIFPSAALEQAQNKGHDSLPENCGRPWFRMHLIKMERLNLIVILQNYVQ